MSSRAEVHARRAKSGVERAARADWSSKLARFGLSAKGVLYAVLGILAVQFAMGSGSSEAASQRGAIQLVASQPFGQVLLGVLTAGLFSLALWHTIQVFKGDPVEGSETKDRVKYGIKALLYFGTAGTALTALLSHAGSGGGGSGSSDKDRATATVLSWSGGQWIVGIFGVIVIGFAIQQLRKHGMNHEFMQRLARTRMSEEVERGVKRAGQAGYTARGIVLGIVGVFFVIAAVQHDPDEAKGLSGALATLSRQGWGTLVLWFVAIGLVLYGLFCFAEARYRRAT